MTADLPAPPAPPRPAAAPAAQGAAPPRVAQATSAASGPGNPAAAHGAGGAAGQGPDRPATAGLLRRGRGSIRGQILAALVAVLVLGAVVAAVGMAVMRRAERDFRALAQDHVPVLALAGELAESTAELSALALQLMADPVTAPGAAIPQAVERASRTVEAVLGSALLAAPPERAATRAGLERAHDELRRAVLASERLSAALNRQEDRAAATDGDLRWSHSDVQDQVQGLLSDLSFDMDARLAELVGEPLQAGRAAAENALTQDRRLRDQLQQLGAEAATLTALLLQARAATSPAALDQAEALGRDTLDLLALAQLNLPRRTDIGLFLQALAGLSALATEEGGVFAQSRQRLALRSQLFAELQTAQQALHALQSGLTRLGRSERLAAQSRADLAATSILHGSLALTLVTLFGLLASAAILAVFVHHRILRRIEILSDDLGRIARGDLAGGGGGPWGQDEIAGMARAVEVFRASVRERQQVIERLEQTQRELVQAGKMAALGQMSAAISHEINQPLAAIGHRLHSLVQLHPESRPAVTRIEALLSRITRTIGHMRRFARRASHRHGRITLAEPLAASLDLLEHRLREEAVTLELAELGGLAVAGDEILLEQVLLNILGNALDAIAATGRGQGRIRIRLAAPPSGPQPAPLCSPPPAPLSGPRPGLPAATGAKAAAQGAEAEDAVRGGHAAPGATRAADSPAAQGDATQDLRPGAAAQRAPEGRERHPPGGTAFGAAGDPPPASDPAAAIELLIEDDGIGLGGQSGAALIDPFFTTKDPGKGLGLGLSIAFNVMQDMGGHLAIDPAPGGGAMVRLRLALWKDTGMEAKT